MALLVVAGVSGAGGAYAATASPGSVTRATAAQRPIWQWVGTAGEPGFNGGAANAQPDYVCGGPAAGSPGCPVYAPVGFLKDSLGFVHLRGSFTVHGDTVVFTLPAGYRPQYAGAFPALDTGASDTKVVIYQSGTVQVISPSGFDTGDVFSLDGISFLDYS